MKLQSLLEAFRDIADNDPKADPELVRKFADVRDKDRPYYIMKWAEKNGMDSDDAMFKAGYVQDGYIGSGAWNWRYIGEDITEGDERPIIQHKCIEKLQNYFSGKEFEYENKDDLEYDIYQALEKLDVKNCVDPKMIVGGQPIGNFVDPDSRVIDVISASDVIYDVMNALDLSQLRQPVEEGKSPHKKGSAKYKKHMAAKHASMGEAMEKKMISIQTSVGLMPAYSDHSPLSAKDYHDWTMKNDKNPPKPNIISQRYGIYLDDFKRYAMESIQIGDELMIETADGEGIVVPVLHVIDENILVGWDEIAEDIFTEQDRQLAELRKLAGLDENLVAFEPPAEVEKAIKDIEKNGLPMSAKFANWCKENDCDFSIDFMKQPKEMKKAAIAKIKFEKETGYGTGGEKLSMRPPKQLDLPFKPRDPKQQELDFDEDLDEAEYQGRKVKLNKPMRGDVKKFKVYVKDPKTGNVKKVNFGHGGTSAKRKTMRIRKSNPKARKSFRARHNCDNPGPKTKARYWSCRKW